MNSGKAYPALGKWMKRISSARESGVGYARGAINARILWKQIHTFVARRAPDAWPD